MAELLDGSRNSFCPGYGGGDGEGRCVWAKLHCLIMRVVTWDPQN